MRVTVSWMWIAAGAIVLAGQQEPPGARLRLVPPGPLEPPTAAQKADPSQENVGAKAIRPAILNLKPVGNPIYVVEEPVENEPARTYRWPKVAAVSKSAEGLALQGWDVVSYFNLRPEMGKRKFSHDYRGATWLFSSELHLKRFKEDPARYLPQYGGFCAYAVARGYPATANPAVFTVQDGRLFLFFDRAVRYVWEQDYGLMVRKADSRWPRLHLAAP